jgi:redox-sensing transcriptional repressor
VSSEVRPGPVTSTRRRYAGSCYFGEFGLRGVGYHVQDLLTASNAPWGGRIGSAPGGGRQPGKRALRHRNTSTGIRYRGRFDAIPQDRRGGHGPGGGLHPGLKERPRIGHRDRTVTTPPGPAQRAATSWRRPVIKGISTSLGSQFRPRRHPRGIRVTSSPPVRRVLFHHAGSQSAAQDAD